MQIVVNGLLTTYQQSGEDKRLLVMLHGWGDSHQTFDVLVSHLSKTYTVVSLDLPGFGASQAPEKVWNLDDYTQFIEGFIKKLKLNPYAFLAHSNGAALAIRGLATGVLSSEKLVVLSGAGIRDRQKMRKLGLKAIAKSGKAATFWLPSRQKQKLRKALYGAAGSDMLVAPELQETFKKTVSQDVQTDATKLKIPVLLIYGENDRATPPLYGRLYHELINDSTLEIVGGAAHFVHQDQATKVAALIEEFLR